MSKTKQYFYELLEKAIQGPFGDVVDFQALRDLLEASIELQIQNYLADIRRGCWLRDSSIETLDDFHSTKSCESFFSTWSSIDDEFIVNTEKNAAKKIVVIQEIDVATNAILSTISSNDESKTFIN